VAYTKDDALAFIESLRLLLGDRAGFKWLADKLSELASYIEPIAAENERLSAENDRLVAENERLTAENQRLRAKPECGSTSSQAGRVRKGPGSEPSSV
jgi:cell shape-determining protein MreC